ncbi:MAG: cytochrome c oxidase assembly protein [Methylobacterium mesophilicum]|nr:cytochrome c oxidase assembly protein [Methylobacterium mesophilicum]
MTQADMKSADTKKGSANRTVALSCVAFFAAMLGAAYAAVPLYTLFCQVTGYGGTTQRVEQASSVILDRPITVRFDANTNGVPWDFEPVQRSMIMKIGETVQAHYKAVNSSSQTTRGTASFNVVPELAGAYFSKIECFCFTDTTLKPGETLDMPVVFYVDPDIVNAPELKNIQTITLSYTFFPTEGKPAKTAQAPASTGNIGG